MSSHIRRNVRRRWLQALAVLSTVALRGQESTPPLSLGEALTRAADRNPSLVAHSFGERAAAAWVEQSGLRPNPHLEVQFENFAGTGRLRGVDELETTVQASQTLERGDKRGKRVTLASRERDLAAREFAARRADATSAAAHAFVALLGAQHRAALAEEPLRLATQTAGLVEARVRAGEVSPIESARIRAMLATARADLARAQAGVAAARTSLAATWGGATADVPRAAGVLRLPASVPDADALLAHLARHPKLELQRAVIATRRAGVEVEQSRAVQDITVAGGIRFLRESRDAGLVAGVSMPLPTRNQNQGGIRAARENLAGAEQALRATEIELRATFTAAWEELKAAHATATALRREALPVMEEAHALVRRAYEQGQLAIIDVQEAQRALAGVRREILDAELAYATALARAEAAAAAPFTATAQLLSPE